MVHAAMALQQHMAPRSLKCSGFTLPPVQVDRSILAGCLHSVPFTRCVMKPIIKPVATDFKTVKTSIFVDDTTMQTIGPSWGVLEPKMVEAIVFFASKVHQINLKLSDKAHIVCSNKKCAATIVHNLKTVGLHFNNSRSARDLGITYTAALTKPSQLLLNRLKKAKPRVTKIKQLAKISKKSRNLFKASAYPAATWGHPSCGITPTNMTKLERIHQS